MEPDALLRRPDYRPAIAAAAAALALYAISLRFGYIFDDVAVIKLDPRIGNPRLWGQFWTQQYIPDAIDRLYRPLTSLSLAVQWWINGDRSWAFHLVNWLLHAAVSAGVAELARRLSGVRAAWGAGLLFAVHPIHVDAVGMIVGRSELLCALFSLGAILLALRRPLGVGRAVAIAACVWGAILSKEHGLLLSFILLSYFLLRQPRQPEDEEERAGMQWLAILLCFSLAGYIIYRESILPFWWHRDMMDWTVNPLVHSYGIDRILMPVIIFGHYVALLFVPATLSIDYSGRAIGWIAHGNDPYLYVGLVAALAWAAGTVWAIGRRKTGAAFCLIGFGVSYFLVSNLLVIIGTIFAERVIYFPSVFLAVLAGMGLGRLPAAPRRGVLGIAVVLLAARTAVYLSHWGNVLGLYRYELRTNPHGIRLYMLVADDLARDGKYAESERIMDRARRELPDYWLLYFQSAQAAIREGDYDRAQRLLEEQMQRQPMVVVAGELQYLGELRAATQPATRPGR